jgi:uncharacterized coiled-coil protein SlyX
MSESSYGSGVAEEVRPEEQSHGEPGTLALSADDFGALEERILRAVNLVKRERLERAAAEGRAAAAEERAVASESKVSEQAEIVENLNREIGALRAEREAVRVRVDKLLSQLDALEV